MNVFLLVILFVARISFSRNSSVPQTIRTRYGSVTLTLYRKIERLTFKKRKAEQDVNFLSLCKTYDTLPKFLFFKLHDKKLENSEIYRKWQNKLLLMEIKSKSKLVKKTSILIEDSLNTLKRTVRWLDFYYIKFFIDSVVKKSVDKVKTIHNKKLERLGIRNSLTPLDPNKVIFNKSKRVLSDREKFLLSFGLNFKLPIFKIDFYNYFLAFENMYNHLKNFSQISDNIPPLRNMLQEMAFKYYYKFNPYKIFSPIFKKTDFDLLKKLKSDESIVICKPDKGQGVVLLDKTDYIEKMQDILNDHNKFMKVDSSDLLLHTLRQEDRINYQIRKFKQQKIISEELAQQLTVSGTQPGIMYGLPKIHKENTPLRPILSANNTVTYQLSKHLISLISNFCFNQYTVLNSYQFVNLITSINNSQNYTMCSFDIKSLFTNIPVDETIEICLSKCFSNSSLFNNFTIGNFKKFLNLTLKNTFFIFNNVLYKQIDGLGMGQPCAPTLSNLFLCHHETKWLNDCPPQFKPALYRRYVDDIFLLFHSPNHIQPFLEYLNSKHSNIQFTTEVETENKLSFLDISITKCNSKFNTSIYRKPTYTGLGTSYFSFDDFKYKLNAIKTLIYRAYNLSSNYFDLHNEFNYLKDFFSNNGYPLQLVSKQINKFLNNIYNPKPSIPTVPKLKLYFKFPYFGNSTTIFNKDLNKILSKYYPQINCTIVFTNPFSLKSILNHKEKLPTCLCSSVIYNFKCLFCEEQYIGSTIRQFYCRYAEHKAISPRTKLPIQSPSFSAIREHENKTGHNATFHQFKILRTSRHYNLRLLETLYIYNKKPSLNTGAPYQLSILHS